MGALAGILNYAKMAGQTLPTSAAPLATAGGTSGTDGTSGTSASTSSATISANDFLSLLVTEMQNQDPTADTDPNEYINQLVQVNSLEQLIDINQSLSTALGQTSTGATTQAATQATNSPAAVPSLTGNSASGAAGPAASPSPLTNMGIGAENLAAQAAALSPAPGNLGIPAVSAASLQVARSLDGHSRSPANSAKLPLKP